MKRIIEYFDTAFVINLPDRTHRRRQAEQEILRIGVSIPCDKLKFYPAGRPTDKGSFQAIGTRRCFNSHGSILELADQSHLRNVLIFADDVSFRDVPRPFEER